MYCQASFRIFFLVFFKIGIMYKARGKFMGKSKSKPQLTDAFFRKNLSSEEYRILRQKGTEPPFSGQYLYYDKVGTYCCKACGQKVFSSHHKFHSNSGWPSFDRSIKDSVEIHLDFTHFMIRSEVVCSRCGSHLGHLFYDYSGQTGLRYCINSIALTFKKH